MERSSTTLQRSVELEMEPLQSKDAEEIASSTTSLDLTGEEDRFMVDADTSAVKSVGTSYLIYLTIGIGGLQVVWTAIMSQGSPYLFSLGVPTYIVSLVWLAGPLSGALVQPCVGILSDRCQHRWGRRKPFIIFGTIATIICMLALPWSADLVEQIFGKAHPQTATVLAQLLAVMWIWILNIALQPVQGGLRSLIVDCCPPHQQAQASAYSSCAQGVGSIVGYAAGSATLPELFPWLGNSQFKVLCAIASILLGSTVATSCYKIREPRRKVNSELKKRRISLTGIVRQVLWNIATVSKRTARVCIVQFFSWIGWFTFLFYITTYIGDVYQGDLKNRWAINGLKTTPDAVLPKPESIRYGTLVMIIFAITSLIFNLFLPLIVTTGQTGRGYKSMKMHRWESIISPKSWLTIPRVWTASHVIYCIVLFSTAFTMEYLPTAFLVATLGISWAVTQWAPLALVSVEIATNHLGAKKEGLLHYNSEDENEEIEGAPSTSDSHDGISQPIDQAGAIMGVYNIAIAAPQIVAAMTSSALFWLFSKWDIVGGEAIGWVIRTGVISAWIAAWLSLGIETMK